MPESKTNILAWIFGILFGVSFLAWLFTFLMLMKEKKKNTNGKKPPAKLTAGNETGGVIHQINSETASNAMNPG